MVTIDGTHGEGGGQIVRTALSLAALTQTPIRLQRIRASRPSPGLSPQHLAAARALGTVTNASLSGATLRSTELTFVPRCSPQAGTYTVDVAEAAANGSAGSVALVLQALLCPLALADGASTVTLKGGTHVRWSPSLHFIQQVYLPTLSDMEVRASVEVQQCGFYPAGGGIVQGAIPAARPPLAPIRQTDRGTLQVVRGEAVSCNLPSHIAERMARRAEQVLQRSGLETAIDPIVVESAGAGAGLFLAAHYEHSRIGCMALGRPGRPAEQVAEDACQALLDLHDQGAPVDPHVADQLVLPMALAEGRSTLRTPERTGHLRTNAHIIQQLIPASIELTTDPEGMTRVEVDGIGWTESTS